MWGWIKRNKLVVGLVVVVGYLLWSRQAGPVGPFMTSSLEMGSGLAGMSANRSRPLAADIALMPKSAGLGEAPPSNRADRLVVTETSLSLVVKEAAGAVAQIKQIAEKAGGYLVNSYLSRPQEAASGSIVVRVPAARLDEALTAFKAVGLRVVSEQVSGRDVTDEYEDLDARLATYRKTKAKFEEILDRANQVQDLLNVQRELVNLQGQIDAVVGRQKYLQGVAEMAKVTVYVSTDEYSLPYAPSEPWRPSVVFKLAVRSLVTHLRSLGSLAIWLAVYSVIWVPLVLVIWWWKRRKV